MGGGGSGNPCTKDGGGSVNPSGKPQPPRNGGAYTTNPTLPSYGVPTRDTGCGNAGVIYHCVGGEMQWSGRSCPCSGQGVICANQYPFADMCPAIGTVSQTDWSGQNVVCKYSAITPTDGTNLFNDSKMAVLTDGGGQARSDFCAPQTFATLFAGGNCPNYYSGKNTLNAEYIVRILREKPSTWPDDQQMIDTVLTISLGVYSNGQPTPDAQSAINMIQTYCLQTNPSWVTNTSMRTFINSLFTNQQGNSRTNANLQAMASTLVNAHCGTAPSSDPACGCFNAVNLQFDGCKTQGGVAGCAEFAHLYTAFSQAPSQFAGIVAHLEQPQFMKPQCVSGACATANQNPGGAVLRVADTASFNCQDNETVCLESLSVGGSIAPGATINQQCSTSFNVASGTVIQATNNNGTLTGTATPVGTPPAATPGGTPPAAPITTGTTPPGQIMVQGTAYNLTDFLIQPGKNSFVDKTLPTPTEQKAALGVCIGLILCCICLIIIMALAGGGEESVGPSPQNMRLARLAVAGN